MENLLLSDYYQVCYNAYRNTSFSPEKRAKSTIEHYSEVLENDLKELGENKGNYKQKFIDKWLAWMNAKGNCISSMITGPSNFPVAKAIKANNREHNAMEAFSKWREKYFKAVNRQRTLSPEEDLDKALKDLDDTILFQEQMKEVNKIIKKAKGDTQQIFVAMVEAGFSEKVAEEVTKPDVLGHIGFQRFELSNNNAKIKRLKEKVLTMKARIERKSEWEDIQFDGGYVTIEDDRLKIYHDEKPEKEVIQEIKSSGFRWSPHWGCWCRKHTGNAIYSMKKLSFLNS